MDTTVFIFLIGIAAGFISGVIGGGSGLVLVPLQILVGIDPRIATTTTHFGFIGNSLGAIARFYREREVNKKYIIPLTILATLSGLLGPYLLLSIEPKFSQQIVAALILVCVPLFLFNKNLGRGNYTSTQLGRIFGYIAILSILTLQVAFGAATGIIAILALIYFFGMSMLEINASLRLPNLVSSLTGLVVYTHYGTVHYGNGLTLFLATLLGGYWGSHVAIKMGNASVKRAFAVFAIVLAITYY